MLFTIAHHRCSYPLSSQIFTHFFSFSGQFSSLPLHRDSILLPSQHKAFPVRFFSIPISAQIRSAAHISIPVRIPAAPGRLAPSPMLVGSSPFLSFALPIYSFASHFQPAQIQVIADPFHFHSYQSCSVSGLFFSMPARDSWIRFRFLSLVFQITSRPCDSTSVLISSVSRPFRSFPVQLICSPKLFRPYPFLFCSAPTPVTSSPIRFLSCLIAFRPPDR